MVGLAVLELEEGDLERAEQVVCLDHVEVEDAEHHRVRRALVKTGVLAVAVRTGVSVVSVRTGVLDGSFARRWAKRALSNPPPPVHSQIPNGRPHRGEGEGLVELGAEVVADDARPLDRLAAGELDVGVGAVPEVERLVLGDFDAVCGPSICTNVYIYMYIYNMCMSMYVYVYDMYIGT